MAKRAILFGNPSAQSGRAAAAIEAAVRAHPNPKGLSNWVMGDVLRLVRERFLAILEAGQVTPIPTVGQSFDPYRHVAVATTPKIPDGLQPLPDLIVSEERRGYQSPVRVLRYAEVIIYRPKP